MNNMGEGEPAPAPAADIKIFISGNSGSKEVSKNSQIKNRQRKLFRNTLEALFATEIS